MVIRIFILTKSSFDKFGVLRYYHHDGIYWSYKTQYSSVRYICCCCWKRLVINSNQIIIQNSGKSLAHLFYMRVFGKFPWNTSPDSSAIFPNAIFKGIVKLKGFGFELGPAITLSLSIEYSLLRNMGSHPWYSVFIQKCRITMLKILEILRINSIFSWFR